MEKLLKKQIKHLRELADRAFAVSFSKNPVPLPWISRFETDSYKGAHPL